MAIKLELYTGERTYMFPTGALATPEVIEIEFSAIKVFPHVVQVNGNVFEAVQELNAMKNMFTSMYGCDFTDKTNDESLLIMENLINNPPVVEVEPTAEERIAAALEYQNLLSM